MQLQRITMHGKSASHWPVGPDSPDNLVCLFILESWTQKTTQTFTGHNAGKENCLCSSPTRATGRCCCSFWHHSLLVLDTGELLIPEEHRHCVPGQKTLEFLTKCSSGAFWYLSSREFKLIFENTQSTYKGMGRGGGKRSTCKMHLTCASSSLMTCYKLNMFNNAVKKCVLLPLLYSKDSLWLSCVKAGI